MSEKTAEIITEYSVLFALRTGVTILLPKTSVLDEISQEDVSCEIKDDHPQDLIVKGKDSHHVIIKDIQKDHLAEAIERGFVMFYELDGEEVVRCTTCRLSSGSA